MRGKGTKNQQSGYALLTTLLVIILITVIGLSVMTMSINTTMLTKGERDNQSSYYIAEAAIVEKRAEINEIARQTYNDLRGEYYELVNPQEKAKFNFNERFNSLVREEINKYIEEETVGIYEKQFNGSPESVVAITPNDTSNLSYNLSAVGRIPSEKESWTEKTVSQNIEIIIDHLSLSEDITIPGSKPIKKLKACYAVSASGPIEYGGDSIEGDIYSTSDIRITNGSIKGNVFSNENIFTNRNITGSVVAKGNLDIQNGIITGSAYGNNISMTDGTVEGNLIATQDLNIGGGKINLDAVSHKDVTIRNYPEINGDIVAKDNIHVNETWFSAIGGKYIYGNRINFINEENNSNKQDKKEKRSDMQLYLNQFPTAQTISQQLSEKDGECLINIPSLPDVVASFPQTQASVPENKTIVYNKPGESYEHSYDVIKNGTLSVDNWIVRDSNYKLVLSEDVYFKQININENITLEIDLQNQNRKIYVDNFNNTQGHIKLLNPGKLEIIVQNNFNSKGILNIDGESEALTVRYAGFNSISLNNESLINGSLHVKEANQLTVHANGIAGDLVAYSPTRINISGGSSVSNRLVLAPFSSLSIDGGGTVKGNVIVKTLNTSGGAKIIPPSKDSGEWEVPGSPSETIQIPVYKEGTDFLLTDSLKQN